MSTVAIIPARYGSQRFPGKLLAPLEDKPILQHVHERVNLAKEVDNIIVATDHEKIREAAEGFGARVVMTSSSLSSGTDRCAAAATRMEEPAEYVINVQGDEPLISPQLIDDIALALKRQDGNIVTAVRRMHDELMLFSPDVVKAVLDNDGKALYFSRHPIPFFRGKSNNEWLKDHTYFQHIGIYGFKTNTLVNLAGLTPSSLEQTESLEQLRWLQNGYGIHTIRTEYESFGVDTENDLDRLRELYE